MQEVEKHGVRLDYCPTCKGIWLDRGEIDRVVKSDDTTQTDFLSHDSELKKILAELRKEGRIS